jgi:integrase/recombinase XerD
MSPARAALPHHHVETFLEMMLAERGASGNTIAAYERDLGDAGAFLARRGGDLATAGPDDLRAYLAALTRRGASASTSARRLSCLRQFFRFLYAEGARGDDPTGAIEAPRRGSSIPKILSEAEVDRLMEVARTGETPALLRRRALVELLYATGLRVSELIALPATAAAGQEAFLVVRGKGDKERLVPIGEAAREAVAAWRAVRAAGSPWLFPSRGRAETARARVASPDGRGLLRADAEGILRAGRGARPADAPARQGGTDRRGGRGRASSASIRRTARGTRCRGVRRAGTGRIIEGETRGGR